MLCCAVLLIATSALIALSALITFNDVQVPSGEFSGVARIFGKYCLVEGLLGDCSHPHNQICGEGEHQPTAK